MPVLQLRHVSRRFLSAHSPPVVALDGVSLEIQQGEFVAIVGPSGGGKSTLLNMLGLLDFPDEGEYLLDGARAPAREGAPSAHIRNTEFAFIFQAFHLLPNRPLRDSVELGLMYRGVAARTLPVASALQKMGLLARAEERASHLSGGQQQRVAIARAMASDARVFLADEPTGNLDSDNAKIVLTELQALHKAGATVVVVTHSSDVAAAADRQLRIQDGRLVSDSRQNSDDAEQAGSEAICTEQPAGTPPSSTQSRPTRSALSVLTGAATSGTGRATGKQVARGLRARDVWRDAWRSVHSRPIQTSALCLAVTIAVALTLTTLGISTSASAQVSSAFDAQLNREVTATWNNEPDSLAAALAEVPRRATQIAGVDAAAAVADFDPVIVGGVSGARQVQPHTYSGAIEQAAGLGIQYPTWRPPGPLEPNEVLVGAQLAELLDMAPLDSGPTVTIDRVAYQVVGIITQSRRLPRLTGELFVAEDAPGFVTPKTTSAVLLTSAGAAQQVARQVPISLNPYAPETVTVTAPTDASQLRVTLEQGVQTTLIAVSILAVVIAVAAIANAMLIAVSGRRGEIGMRKALGARRRHIAWLLGAESVYVGAMGGITGLAVGVTAILAVTLTQQWAPVFDLRLGPVAVIAGVVIGACGGIAAAVRAAQVRPADSLRQ